MLTHCFHLTSFDRPLEVIGHDGVAVNVTMLPGDMVLYESHSIIHGRPFALKGRYMANVFIHFEPIGSLDGQIEFTGDLPPYLIPGSPEEPNLRSRNPNGHVIMGNKNFATGSTLAHHYASTGDVENLKRHLDKQPHHINARDKNGWTVLHEAVRKGDTDMINLVLDRGADVNMRTGVNGEGGSPLYWAYYFHQEGSEVIELLKERNGKNFKPEL
jgi:prolyl 4-hydroxylase